MPPVAIVTDSTPYLPRELVAAHDIEEVSLYVSDGDGQRRESDITDYVAFYDGLRAMTALPTTSQPSIGDFLAVYEPLAEAGRDIVSVHLSGGIWERSSRRVRPPRRSPSATRATASRSSTHGSWREPSARS